MLYKAKTLKGYSLDSLDGEFGQVNEFYFDDRHWTIRYLIANTGAAHLRFVEEGLDYRLLLG